MTQVTTRRKILAAICVGGFSGLASAQNNGDGGTDNEVGEDSLLAISDISDLNNLPFDPNVVVELEGEGSSVTDEFELDSGLTVFVYESEVVDIDGLEADLEQTDGDDDYTLAIFEIVSYDDEIDEVTGASLVDTEGGEYLLDISTEGEWAVHVAQPRAPDEEVRIPPVSVEGENSTVVGPVEADDGMTVSGEHHDEEEGYSFEVTVFQEDGEDILSSDYAFIEDAGFQGESRVDVDGVTWASINTRGEWSLEFRE